MTHPGNADASVFVVDEEGEADQTVFAVNGILDLAPAEGDTIIFTGGKWVAQAGGCGGGGASTPPGQAAHYIGTWDIAHAYAAGDCVRAWTGSVFKLYQADTTTTGADPVDGAPWVEVTTPIVMWGSAVPQSRFDPTASGTDGVPAPFASVYIYADPDGTEVPFYGAPSVALWERSGDVNTLGYYWVAGSSVTIPDTVDGDLQGGTSAYRGGSGDGSASLSTQAQRSGSGTGDATNSVSSSVWGDATGGASASVTAYRFGSGTGDATAQSNAAVYGSATGTAFAGNAATHHAGGEAHVLVTADADKATVDIQGKPQLSGGSEILLPGGAAHYIGTWSDGFTYLAGDCVRQWDGAEWKLYQAKKLMTTNNPTLSPTAWVEVTTPIVMWGTENPITTDQANLHGGGVIAPDGSAYLFASTSGTGLFTYDEFINGPSNSQNWRGGSDTSFTATVDSGSLYAPQRAVVDGAGAMNLVANAYIQRTGSGVGGVDASHDVRRSGSGGGNATATRSATVEDTGTGTAYAGDTAIHHAGGEAHVLPTANAAEAWIDTKGPVDLLEVGSEPAVPAVNIGRLFAIDDGAGHTQLVVKFNDGGRVVLATDGGTLGPTAQGNQKVFNQTANATTLTTVGAALSSFSGTLLSDVLTAIPTLIAGVNDNRKLINAVIDVLQEIKAAQ